MTLTNRTTLLLFLFISATLYSQERVPLRDYLIQIEQRTNFTFAYKDSDLDTHLIQSISLEDVEGYIEYLADNSLFDYQVLKDRTVAIRLRKDVSLMCAQLGSGNWRGRNVSTNYQQVLIDTDSRFKVWSAPNNTPLDVRIDGYEPLQLNPTVHASAVCPTIEPEAQIETLNEVFLTNYFAKGISKNNDGSLTVDYNDFDILPGLIEPDVLLTLQALPGIQSVNETVSFINIRGGTNDQNLILWDGIKMYQNGHFFGQISAFNPLLTKRVDLYKNASPARYSDGVSGVVDMYSDPEINQDFFGEVGVNLLSADGFFDVPLGDIGSIQISGRKSINNLWQTPTYNSYFDKAFQNTELTSSGNPLPASDDEFNFFDVSFRLLVKPSEKDTFRANFLQIGNQLKFLENAEIDGLFDSRRSDLEQNNLTGGFFYQRQWTDEFDTQLQVYGTTYEIESTNVNVLSNQRLLQRNKIRESGFRALGNYRVSEELSTVLGYQFNETGITNFEEINNPFFQRTDKQVLRTHGLFAEAEWDPFEQVTIDAGLRINHVGKFDEILIEPRLALSYRFLEYFTVELLGELKSQTSSQIIDFQNDFLGVENRRWVLSNPGAIPIIKSEQLSAGISFNRKGWLLSIEPYIKSVDGITTQSQGFQNQFENIRTSGSYQTYGVDLLVNKRFRKVNTWLSYTYSKNDYTFDALQPSTFPNNIDIRHYFTYGINYSINAFNVSAGLNWHTGKPTTLLVPGEEVVDGGLNFDEPNAVYIDDYYRVDLSATYRLKLKGGYSIQFGASIWNVLDTRNVINHFFVLDENQQPEEVDEFALGITPNFSVRFRF